MYSLWSPRWLQASSSPSGSNHAHCRYNGYFIPLSCTHSNRLFWQKMEYKNVRLHLLRINSHITVAVVYLLICCSTFCYGSKRLPYKVNDMFQLRNLREIWNFHRGMRRWEFGPSWIRRFVARFVVPNISKTVRSVETSGNTNQVAKSPIQ
jgi:hypothetical protein